MEAQAQRADRGTGDGENRAAVTGRGVLRAVQMGMPYRLNVRSNLDPAKQAAYEAARRFVEVGLRSDGSLFLPDRGSGQHLYSRTFTPASTWLRTYLTLVRREVRPTAQGAPAATIQLAAEIVFVHFLIAHDIGASAKRRLIDLILGWSPEPISIPGRPPGGLHDRVCNTGVAFKTYRPNLLWFLIDRALAWKTLAADRRSELLADPWAFKDWVESVPQKAAYTQRQALLHLVFPEEFEDMVSRSTKA